ncbi:MAG: oxidoreductase-like domain-containing protein [Alysiella sp.]|uniref:oxidoreductase-like domain-containing protein n=1 Tax=Alysiella sp. TaxID=1872483 RepID=UPI0026DCEA14|nr:oxidoreductase-like domain-containing protein [Alysiella sp.]MDO4433832.1 oxidoreductase-like domain-containing protein [Alysiella sp.]
MDATQKLDLATLPPKPEPPEDWECCGSECGDACIYEIYRREKAAYDAAVRQLQVEDTVNQAA